MKIVKDLKNLFVKPKPIVIKKKLKNPMILAITGHEVIAVIKDDKDDIAHVVGLKEQTDKPECACEAIKMAREAKTGATEFKKDGTDDDTIAAILKAYEADDKYTIIKGKEQEQELVINLDCCPEFFAKDAASSRP